MKSFSDPDSVIEQFNIADNSTVVDMGSGSGFYSLACARAMNHSGKVYAVDIQKELLSKLKNFSTQEGFVNVEVIWGNIENSNGTSLRDGIADVVVLANILFQVGNKREVLKEAFRVLKTDGRMLIVDWTDSFGGLGPHPNEILAKDDAINLSEESGFLYQRDIDTGVRHYGIIFNKN